MSFEQARRLQELPPYIFSEINRLKADATAKGISLLSLGIGDPDKPTPDAIVKKLQEACAKPENHVYSPYEGTLAFRRSVADWFQTRFGVSVDPQKEVMALIGSKEAIAHFPVAFCNPGDVCLYPSPGYPVFGTSILLGGGRAVPMPLSYENSFLPDLNWLEDAFRQHSPRYMILNYPSNPTSAVCPRKTLEDMVSLARKYNVAIVYDNAYSEIYYDEKPISVLQIPGGKDVAIEFHSFSKSYNMTGWRLGFAVGNPDLVAGLLRAKTNIDSGPLLTVQEAGTYALQNSEALTTPIRQVYAERRERLLSGLRRLGIEYFHPQAGFFVWARVPGGQKSMDLTKALIETQGLVVTPGVGFGDEGEGFFRLAMTVEPKQIDEALNRLEAYLKR